MNNDELTIVMPCELNETVYQIHNNSIRKCVFCGVQKYSGINKGETYMYIKVLPEESTSSTKKEKSIHLDLIQLPLTEINVSVFTTFDKASDALHKN